MRLILLFGIFTSAFIYHVYTDDMISLGNWYTMGLEKCPENDLPISVGLKKFKLNRTHDCFNLSLILDEDISAVNSGIHIEVCKKTDGGCKLQTIYDDHSFCNTLKTYAKENFIKLLTAAGVEPADCPIPKGEYSVVQFYFDYEELPEKNLLGEFSAKVQLMRRGRAVGCVIFNYIFEKKDDKE